MTVGKTWVEESKTEESKAEKSGAEGNSATRLRRMPLPLTLPARAKLSLTVPPALVLALTGCAQTNSADFGAPIPVSHPVGAYSSEFRRGNDADVVYLVENVSRTGPDRVDFDLTVTVPPLGRMFGFVRLEVVCVANEQTSAADTDEYLGEDHEGVFEFPMRCEAPEDADHLAVEINHHDEHLRFEGPLG